MSSLNCFDCSMDFYLLRNDIAEPDAAQRHKTEVAPGKKVPLKNGRSHNDVSANGLRWKECVHGVERFPRIYPMIIISDVVIGTDTVLVSFADFFEDEDDDADTAISSIWLSSFILWLWLEDDVLLLTALISSSDRYSSCNEMVYDQMAAGNSANWHQLTSSSSSSRAMARIFLRVRYARRLATPGHMRHKHTFA